MTLFFWTSCPRVGRSMRQHTNPTDVRCKTLPYYRKKIDAQIFFWSLLAISPEHVQLPPVGFQTQMICIFAKCPSFSFYFYLTQSAGKQDTAWLNRFVLCTVCMCMYLMLDQTGWSRSHWSNLHTSALQHLKIPLEQTFVILSSFH